LIVLQYFVLIKQQLFDLVFEEPVAAAVVAAAAVAFVVVVVIVVAVSVAVGVSLVAFYRLASLFFVL
jgi:hypothetical protein